ncbi:MAG TPA: response regulator transcription factor [Thermoanaerobaculia bacterium]|nr:response regulator transcription factor [Thermoanaerobaculia bacterium]
MRRIIAYGLLGGVLVALLKVIEYEHFVHTYPGEIYGGLVAVVFVVLGIWLGQRWRRSHEVVVREVPVEVPAAGAAAPGGPFAADLSQLERLGITQREYEILRLIAEGLSNREIGERAFIAENTVKTHSSRLFDKLGVSRRVQAVQRARELRLLP